MAMVEARERAERNWPRTFAIAILLSLFGLGLMLGYIYLMDYLQTHDVEVESPTVGFLYGMGLIYLVLMAPVIMMGSLLLIMAPIFVLIAWIGDKIKRRKAQTS